MGNLLFSWTNDIEIRNLGYLHDIGYGLSIENPKEHNRIGGLFLKKCFYNYWEEVFYHGEIDPTYESKPLILLNKADLQVDRCGNLVSPIERLKDIGNRHGVTSMAYKNANILAKKLKLV